MMKIKIILIALLICLLLGMQFIQAKSQAGVFVIQNADATTDLSISPSSTLNNLVANVVTRFVVQYANGMRIFSVSPIPAALNDLVLSVGPRPVIQYANSNKYYSITYPKDALNDVIPPNLYGAGYQQVGAGSVNFNIWTNEYTTVRVSYGTQPGQYTQIIEDHLFNKFHELPVTGLTIGQTYYYQAQATDRSGNVSNSMEVKFQIVQKLFLPMLKR